MIFHFENITRLKFESKTLELQYVCWLLFILYNLQLQNQNMKWMENMAVHLLCVLALDRFGDFVSDEVSDLGTFKLINMIHMPCKVLTM